MAAPIVQPKAFTHYEDANRTKHVLGQLSAGATNAETASRRCQQSIKDVQRLLDPDSLTKYSFKKSSGNPSMRSSGEKTAKKTTPNLSSFAKMVLDNSEVPFTYITPDQSPVRQLKHQEPVAAPTQAPLATTPSFVAPTDTFQNGVAASQGAVPPTSSQQRQVSAVMPTSLSQAQRAEYQYMPDQDSVAGAQYLTPSKAPASSSTKGNVTTAQKHKGDIAVETLKNTLAEVFEAEDQMQPDTSGQAAAHAMAMFEIRDTENGSQPVLRSETQSKLESCISKVVNHGRLAEIETEQLVRAQRLCEIPVASVESLAFSIGDDWNDQDAEEWLQRVASVDHGLAATRALVRIMTGAAQLKELQSEDYLNEVLDAVRAVVEGCIIPIVEESPVLGEKIRGEKGGPPANPKFKIAYKNRSTLQALLLGTTRAMRYLGELLVKTDFDDTSLSKVEYFCKSIIFAENSNPEKDSVFGVQTFENIRRCAMDVYAKIFTKYTNQRQYILDEILMSLEKLPATKQSARQYRPVDTKPIQLVSALLMRLVQTSATPSRNTLKLRTKDSDAADEAGDSDEDSEELESDDEGVKVARKKEQARPDTLASIVRPLHDTAQSTASYIVTSLISRALTTSKSSDEPYRRLLDIFTEDFLNVLGSSDWPAAEILLLTLVKHMINIIEKKDKSPAPSRTLALELLAVMGSGIIEIQFAAREQAQGIDATEEIANRLKNMVQQSESGELETYELVALDGPYRIWAEYLNEKGADEDPLLQSAHGYMLMQWAHTAIGQRDGSVDSEDGDVPGSSKDLQSKLREMLLDPKWLDDRSTRSVGTSKGKLAVLVATLNSKFCKAFQRIFHVLLNSMGELQPTVKSRGLKSLVMLLEKDPSMLDRNAAILHNIVHCTQDQSSKVRDSALGLIQTCVSLRPKLDSKMSSRLIDRTRDTAVPVRKRAVKMLKDMYLRNRDSLQMRAAIADAVIARIEDMEEGVVDLARTTMEEVWFHPFYGKKLDGERALDAKLAFRSHASLVIATVDRDDNALKVLESLTRRLVTSSKTDTANVEVCRTLVTVLFDGIIDNNDIPGAPAQSAILRSLTIFAKATPTLFTAAQLERLEPYTKNLTSSDELEVYRYVITILRYVMPNLAMMNKEFLQKMQTTLLTSSTRLQKPELREVAPCLWTINKMLGNIERLVNFLASVVKKIHDFRGADFSDSQLATKASRLMTIAGEFGNACDFERQLAGVKAKGQCTWYRGDSVPGLIVELLCTYTSPKLPTSVRQTAIDGICTVAQAWPKQFLRADVINAFETVFKDRIPEIEAVLLAGLESFFVAQEVPEDSADAAELPAGIASGTERLGRTYVASDTDGASTSLAQRFLSSILRIAISTCTEPAFIAARLVVSINKQGLVHPKESGPALVALETCPNKTVASEAFKEHKAQHQKHESLFEKEYMRAVQQTFDYQAGVIGDAKGFLGQPPTAKMHLTFEVLKSGKAQVRKKFMTNISQKLDFDPAKLDLGAVVPTHLAFVRFCCENLAFFEYDKVDDLLHLLASLEKIFSSTGSSIAQAIESDVLKMQVDNLLGSEGLVNGTSDTIMTQSSHTDVDPARLRQLSVSAQIISLIWETRSFLRRVWNTQNYVAKAKGKEKDANKTPKRSSNAAALTEAFLKRVKEVLACSTAEQDQRNMCTAFVELISVDTEAKVAASDDENVDIDGLAVGDAGFRDETPSENSSRKSPSVGASGGGRGRKRKSSVSAAGTPRKRGRPRKSASFNVGGDDEGGWD